MTSEDRYPAIGELDYFVHTKEGKLRAAFVHSWDALSYAKDCPWGEALVTNKYGFPVDSSDGVAASQNGAPNNHNQGGQHG